MGFFCSPLSYIAKGGLRFANPPGLRSLPRRMHCFASARNDKCLRQINTTGKSVPSRKNLSSPSRKNIPLPLSGRNTLRLPPSCPTRGASAVVANAGQGAVDAMVRKTSASVAYGEIVWVRRPDAGVKFKGSQRCPRAMVSQKAGSPGRSRISRKAIAQGRPDASAKPVCSCAAYSCATCT